MSSDSNGRMREHLFNFTRSCASIIKSVSKILMDGCESTFLVSHAHVHQSVFAKFLIKKKNERFGGVNLPWFLNNARLNLIPKMREETPSKSVITLYVYLFSLLDKEQMHELCSLT